MAFAGIVYRNIWRPAVRRGVTGAWAHLFTASALPHSLGLLILGDVLFVLLLAAVIVIALQAKKQNQSPDWLSLPATASMGSIRCGPTRDVSLAPVCRLRGVVPFSHPYLLSHARVDLPLHAA